MSTRSTAERRGQAAGVAAALIGLASLTLLAAHAGAKPYVPRNGQLYHGVSDTGEVRDFNHFRNQVKEHPAVLQEFFHWDVSLTASKATKRWDRTDTLGVVSMSTKLPANGRPDISPQAIAKGRGDHYLLRLNEITGNLGQPTYMRLMPEMNGHWNPYSAFNADGTRRGRRYTTGDFKRAWRRVVLIVQGGSRDRVNRKLRRNHLPRIYRAKSNHAPIYDHRDVPRMLERPKIAFMWVPQTFGSPNIPGNQPQDYWPGGRFVDWVGADIFSKFQTAFDDLQAFYRRYDDHPFVIGEYSPWDGDPNGAFTRRLLDWSESHGRVRMLIYYRSVTADNEFYISHYPAARGVLRRHLGKGRWDPFAPHTRD